MLAGHLYITRYHWHVEVMYASTYVRGESLGITNAMGRRVTHIVMKLRYIGMPPRHTIDRAKGISQHGALDRTLMILYSPCRKRPRLLFEGITSKFIVRISRFVCTLNDPGQCGHAYWTEDQAVSCPRSISGSRVLGEIAADLEEPKNCLKEVRDASAATSSYRGCYWICAISSRQV